MSRVPSIRTDDAPRRLRAVWLGPRGHTLSWAWEYRRWATFGAIWLGFSAVLGLILWQAEPLLGLIAGPMWAMPFAHLVTARLMPYVDYDRPIRYWRRVIPGEWKRSQQTPTGERQVRVNTREIVVVHDWSMEVLRTLYLRSTDRCAPLAQPRWGWRQ
ncbi:MAG: hypothetical protein GEU93_02435 [Propionibacteriales bacterium]|nr:hypothetical protein [Propionibacteriales bacterium]